MWLLLTIDVGHFLRFAQHLQRLVQEFLQLVKLAAAGQRPGSTQLARAQQFLLTLPWHQLAPAANVFTGAMSAAATTDGRCALAFTAGGKTMTADLAKLRGPVAARWFDPTSGAMEGIKGGPLPARGSREFAPPGKNSAGDSDWVLVLSDAAGGFSFPGQKP